MFAFPLPQWLRERDTQLLYSALPVMFKYLTLNPLTWKIW